MAVRRSAGQGDPADELGAKDGNDRRVEIVRGEDRRRPVAVVELRPGTAVEPVDDAAAHVAKVRGAFAEIVVVDAREQVGLFGGRPIDRLRGRRSALDQRQCRLDDPRVAGEECLGFEDRTDLLARPAGGLSREGVELVGGRGERREEPLAFHGRVASRRAASDRRWSTRGSARRAARRGMRRGDRRNPQESAATETR